MNHAHQTFLRFYGCQNKFWLSGESVGESKYGGLGLSYQIDSSLG